MEYSIINNFSTDEIKTLYEDAGWFAYTKDMERLMEGIKASLFVVSAWEDKKLVGLVRIVGDGKTIIYIQDILVASDYRRNGIGSKLLKIVLNYYKDVRQKVLMTDDSEENRAFYEQSGFIPCDNGELVGFVKFE